MCCVCTTPFTELAEFNLTLNTLTVLPRVVVELITLLALKFYDVIL